MRTIIVKNKEIFDINDERAIELCKSICAHMGKTETITAAIALTMSLAFAICHANGPEAKASFLRLVKDTLDNITDLAPSVSELIKEKENTH